MPYSCQAQFGKSGKSGWPIGSGSTVRGIARSIWPFLDIDDRPHHEPAAVRQVQLRPVDDRRVGYALARQLHRSLHVVAVELDHSPPETAPQGRPAGILAGKEWSLRNSLEADWRSFGVCPPRTTRSTSSSSTCGTTQRVGIGPPLSPSWPLCPRLGAAGTIDPPDRHHPSGRPRGRPFFFAGSAQPMGQFGEHDGQIHRRRSWSHVVSSTHT